MTKEELKRNIDAGREWLRAHGFRSDDHLKDFSEELWVNSWCNVEIYEIDEDYAKAIIDGRVTCGFDIWTCMVGFDDEVIEHTYTRGSTPKEALERSLREYDDAMPMRRERRFGAILNKKEEK